MKKYKIILIIASIIFLLATIIVYAQTSTPVASEEKQIVSAEMIDMSSSIFSKLDSTENISKTEVIKDKLTDKTLYQISNDKYSINLDSSNNLVGIYSKYINCEGISQKLDKTASQNYIVNKYSELALPSEYELIYLEQFDNEIWQANFEKNYNGIYNKYESVKVFFIPETDEIVALTVFNEKTNSSEVSVTKEDAILTASKNLGIDSSDIVSSEISIEKANTYYDQANSDSTPHTSWVLETKDNTFIYVDANSNSIIGGDCIE